MQAERYIAAADLGSYKIALSVARVEGDDIQIIYYKEKPSAGIRYSGIFNPKQATGPLKELIDDAQQELNIKILQLVVGLPRYRISQEIGSARIERSDPDSCITAEEINSLKSMAIDAYPITDENKEEIYGAVAQSFSADDELVCASESDVIGMTANIIDSNFKIFIGTHKQATNIDLMLNTVGVAPAHKLFIPSVVAGAVLTDAEKENGVALLDIGSQVSSVTIYKGRLLRHYSSIPFGGRNITSDIKYECGFTEVLSENIKLAFGACIPDRLASLSEKVIQINNEETGAYEHLPVRYLSEIIDSRAREILQALLFQIQESGFADSLRSGMVITGGGANLVNFCSLAHDMSGYTVRIGYPRTQVFSSGGCAGVMETSAAATVGMILEAKRDPRLNCIEELKTPVVDDNADEAKTGELFTDEVSATGEVVVPTKGQAGSKKAKKVSWFKRLASKAEDKLGEAVDNSIGGLFDKME